MGGHPLHRLCLPIFGVLKSRTPLSPSISQCVMSSENDKPSKEIERPSCMVTLGLLPPYSPEDVEKAYLAKLKEIRPDLGGDREAFYAVQNAYAQAKEYVKFRGDRRGWI